MLEDYDPRHFRGERKRSEDFRVIPLGVGPRHTANASADPLVPGMYSILDVVLRPTCSTVGVW